MVYMFDYSQIGLGGGGDWWSVIVWFVLMFVMFMFYPRLMVSQVMYKLERTANKLEGMSNQSKKFLATKISKKADKKINESVSRFFEFFTITPVSLDPAGIVSKFDHIIREQRDRFTYFVDQVAPKMDAESKANMEMGFAAGISLYDITKIVRHYVELVKKTKSYQIALILQMQMPLIEKIADALFAGTKTLANGEPIGDSLGPLVAASLISSGKQKEIEETIIAKTKIDGRNIFVLKAKGPGGRLGFPGKIIESIASKNKIKRIISVDAAAKLEGEKTGSIAEGVGVAMGGVGVERSYIESSAVGKKIPLDSIVVKMSQEEAITPMRKAIKDALPKVHESIKRSLQRTRKGDNIILIGVGNTSGVGNSKDVVKNVSNWVDKEERKRKAVQKKSRGFFFWKRESGDS